MEILIKEKLDGLGDTLYKPLEKRGRVVFEKSAAASDQLFRYILEQADFFDLLMENEKILDLESRMIYIIRDLFHKRVRFISKS